MSDLACPICADSVMTPLYANLSSDGALAIHRCGGCGLARREPPRVMEFEELPLDAYMDDFAAVNLSGLEFQSSQFDRAARKIAPWLVKEANWQRRMLDVGCGAAYLCTHFRAHGWQVGGIDPWRALADWSTKYLKVPVQGVRVEQAAAPAEPVDLVTAIDVISYTEDPVAFLHACARQLKPGGMLQLTTPNFDCEARQQHGGAWEALGAEIRGWFFTPAALQAAADLAGFTALQITTAGGPADDQELFLFAQRPFETGLKWSDIAEDTMPDEVLPPLDRARLDESVLSEEQQRWCRDGYLILRDFLPGELVDRYSAVRERVSNPMGWDDETPYMEIDEIKDLCLYPPLLEKLATLIGEPMVMNLNLTGWRTTQRDWHQDDYLNPDDVRGRYLACWMALDDVDEHCGPFQFVPGSHRWPHVKRSKVQALLPPAELDERYWPIYSERFLTPFFEAEIARRAAPVRSFTAGKGDVLIWHARLLHRGRVARDPERERRAIICHYTAFSAICPTGPVERWDNGGLYYADPRKRTADPARLVRKAANAR